MFRQMALIALIVSLLSSPALGQCTTYTGGNIYPPGETWDMAGSPYCITSSVRVYDGATLTIDPGVEVRFDAGLGMQVEGLLIAMGTEADPIVFTADDDDPTNDYWAYIWFSPTSESAVFDQGVYVSGCIMEYCEVEHAGSATGSVLGAVRIEECGPFINFCQIHDNDNNGIYVDGGGPKISNNRIENHTMQGVYYTNGSGIDFTYNTIQNNVNTSLDGCGLYIDHSAGIVENNDFLDNSSSSGGAIYAYLGADETLLFEGNRVMQNDASGFGGGMYLYQYFAASSTIQMTNEQISFNQSGSSGGGIYTRNQYSNFATLSISDSTISHNSSNGDGGGYYYYNTTTHEGNIIVDDCRIFGNGAAGRGGGVYVWYECNATITDNQIFYNSAADYGGGVYLYVSSGTVGFTGNVIAENLLTSEAETYGHGMYILYLPGVANTTIRENAFIRNDGTSFTADYQGVAVFNNDCDEGNLMYCTVAENSHQGTTAGTATAIWLQNPDDLDPLPMQQNNITGNGQGGDLWLCNGNSVTTANLDATLNWWGTTSYTEIDDHVWDYFDDAGLGIVDVYPAEMELIGCATYCAPPPPPSGLDHTPQWLEIDLQWDPLEVGNLCGYRIYYDSDTYGYPYEGTDLNEGNSGEIEVDASTTQITLTGFTSGEVYHLAVTALTAGHDDDCFATADNIESWYSVETVYPAEATLTCQLNCTPALGTLPFGAQFDVSLDNLYTGQSRRMAARIDVTLAGGQSYSNWRAGFTNINAGGSFTRSWNQPIPDLGSLVGDNIFTLVAEDVTPAPYNLPPYPPSGGTDADSCTITGVAP